VCDRECVCQYICLYVFLYLFVHVFKYLLLITYICNLEPRLTLRASVANEGTTAALYVCERERERESVCVRERE